MATWFGTAMRCAAMQAADARDDERLALGYLRVGRRREARTLAGTAEEAWVRCVSSIVRATLHDRDTCEAEVSRG